MEQWSSSKNSVKLIETFVNNLSATGLWSSCRTGSIVWFIPFMQWKSDKDVFLVPTLFSYTHYHTTHLVMWFINFDTYLMNKFIQWYLNYPWWTGQWLLQIMNISDNRKPTFSLFFMEIWNSFIVYSNRNRKYILSNFLKYFILNKIQYSSICLYTVYKYLILLFLTP